MRGLSRTSRLLEKMLRKIAAYDAGRTDDECLFVHEGRIQKVLNVYG